MKHELRYLLENVRLFGNPVDNPMYMLRTVELQQAKKGLQIRSFASGVKEELK